MEAGMEVVIYATPVGKSVNIVFVDNKPDGRQFVAKPVKLEFEEFTGQLCEPTLRIEGNMATKFLDAFAEALDGYGVKTDKDAKIQGTLEATRYHLQDLRHLLKLPQKVKT